MICLLLLDFFSLQTVYTLLILRMVMSMIPTIMINVINAVGLSGYSFGVQVAFLAGVAVIAVLITILSVYQIYKFLSKIWAPKIIEKPIEILKPDEEVVEKVARKTEKISPSNKAIEAYKMLLQTRDTAIEARVQATILNDTGEFDIENMSVLAQQARAAAQAVLPITHHLYAMKQISDTDFHTNIALYQIAKTYCNDILEAQQKKPENLNDFIVQLHYLNVYPLDEVELEEEELEIPGFAPSPVRSGLKF